MVETYKRMTGPLPVVTRTGAVARPDNLLAPRAYRGPMWSGLRPLTVLVLLSTVFAGCIDDGAEPAPPEGADGSEDDASAVPLWDRPRDWPENTGMGDEERIGLQSQQIIFGGSVRSPLTRVLLVPPAHGDVGSPLTGPAFEEYLDVTVKGIQQWLDAIERFVADYPEYDHLLEIDIEIEVFDSAFPPETLGYDIVAGFVETAGPAFRGVAWEAPGDIQAQLDKAGLGDQVHWGNRYMLMSLFSSAPRAGQLVPDHPELNDLESVTMHEFAHVWGIGHTTTWTEHYGPDLMNSPYAWVYGDGDPAGDGGVRTPLTCVSTLNLVALAEVYAWIPSGEWEDSGGEVELPADMDYKLYCRDGTFNVDTLEMTE